MKRSTPLMITAIATGTGAVLIASLSMPAAFADTTASAPTPTPSSEVTDYEQPVAPTAEQLAAAGLSVTGLTITPGADSYTVSFDSISLANGVTDAELSIGDNRSHNGGVNYTDWLEITPANNGTGYSTTIPVDDGDYTVTVSAGHADADGNPLLGNLAETAVSVTAE